MSSSKLDEPIWRPWSLMSPAQLRESYTASWNPAINLNTKYHSDTGIGIEIEVERIGNAYNLTKAKNRIEIDPFWKVTTDGSLRDDGLEFVSWVGMNVTEAIEGVYRLNALFKDSGWNFSPRCGIHVHIAFNGSTLDNIKNFFMLYGLFENSLFAISGNRKDNKFCCPVRESSTEFPEILQATDRKDVYRYLKSGQKYLAFNYKPLLSYGTIEFRHHYGTGDPSIIGNWVDTINTMYKYAHKKTFDEIKAEILELNTVSSYEAYAKTVFGDLVYQFKNDLQLDMREGCLFIKECLTPIEKAEVPKVTDPFGANIHVYDEVNPPVDVGRLQEVAARLRTEVQQRQRLATHFAVYDDIAQNPAPRPARNRNPR